MKWVLMILFHLGLGLSCYSQPTIQTSGPTTFCQGGSVTLTAVGTTGSPTYQWTKDGSNILTATSSSYTANTSGTYTVILNPGNNPDTLTPVIVTVNPNPVADFTFTNNNSCAGTLIQFNPSISIGTAPFTYHWNFGDGGSSTAQNPTHSFVSLGCGTATFSDTLTVVDANGCSNTPTVFKSLTVKQIPDVQIADQNAFSPFSNCSNSPTVSNPNYTLTINNISPSASCISTYSINWGDGNVQNNVSFPITHTYTQLGAFNLVVTATGTNGCINTVTHIVANQSNPGAAFGTVPNTSTGCAPLTVPFLISNWQNNSPGTIYTINFGDGSQAINLPQPLNSNNTTDTIYHTYTTSSCPNQSFVTTLNVSNACSSTPYTASNILVYKKPVSNFTATLSSCVNTPVTFTNTSTLASNPNCSTTTTFAWNFGDGNSSTSTSPIHTFTATGVYTVTLISTGYCGNDTTTRTICIVAQPTSVFTINNNTGCTPLSVTTTNNSSAQNDCTPATYLWTVSYSAANCGTSSSWSFTNNTNSSSINPSFIFNNPGIYTINLSVTNACGTVTSNKTVTVKNPPSVTLTTIPNICAPATINPSATVLNCGGTLTYAWSFPGGNPSSSTSANPGSITYNTAGTYTVSLTVTNECGPTTATQQFNVINQPATPTANSNSPLCSGSTLNLSASTAPAGTSYAWTGPNGFTSATQNPVIANVTTAMSGTYNVTVSLNGCSSTPAAVSVVINQTPNLPTVTSPVNYCQGAAASQLSAAASVGNSLLWYTVATGGSGIALAPTPSTASIGTTTYYVSQLNSNATCESGRVPIVVNVSAVPNISGSSTNPTTCLSSNGTIILTGLAPNTTYNVQFTKNGGTSTTVSLTSNGSGVITIANLSAGAYTNITATLNGCTSNVVGPFTLVDPSPPATPTAGSNSPLCSGGTLNLTTSTTTVGSTFSWTGPGGFTSSLQNPSIANVTTGMSGTYSVTASLNGCTSAPTTTTVVISQTPSVPTVTSPVNYCQGVAAMPLTATVSAGNTLNWYTVATGGTGNATAPTPSTASIGTTTYYVSQVDPTTLCESSRSAIVVNVYAIPNISGNSTNPTTCLSSNGTITLTGLTPNLSYNVDYTKNGGTPTTGNLTANGSGAIIIGNLSAGTYTNITAAVNGCTSNVIGPFTLVDPSPPATPTAGSNSPLCSGSSLNLTASSTTAGSTYSWTGPAGFSSLLQNPVISNTTAAMSGTYNVTALLNGCSSSPASVSVVINQTPALPTVTTPVNYCQGAAATPLTAAASAGNTLLWYNVAIGGTGSATAPTPSTTSVGTTTYYVSQVNPATSCEGGRASMAVNVYTVPNIIGSSTNPLTCNSTDGIITLTGLTPNTTYNVQYIKNGGAPTTVNLMANSSGIIAITNLSAGTYTNITVTLNGCTSNIVGPFSLTNPSAPIIPTVTSNSPLCSGSTLNLNATTVPAGTIYSWTGPGGFTSSLQNPVISNVSIAMNGTYSVTTSLNGCTSTPATVSVIINQTPAIPAVSTPVNYCQGANGVQLTAITTAGNTLLWYTTATGGTGSTTAPTPSTASVGSTTYYVSQTNLTTTCESGRTPIVVNVYGIPNIVGSSTNPTSCTSSDGTIYLSGLTPNSFYAVQYTKNGEVPTTYNFTANSSGVITIANLSAGTYTDISAALNGCLSNIVGPFTLVDPFAPATPVLTSNSPLCTGSTLNLTANNVPTGGTYSWIGPGGFTSSLPNPIRPNLTTAMSGTYGLIVTLNNCSSIQALTNVVIGDYPIVNLGPDLLLPYGSQYTFNPTIQNGPISNYLWAPPTNLSCTTCLSPVADIKMGITYSLEVTNIFGCKASDTINIKVICENSQVFIPNAFTPDGDGINDIFMIRGSGPITIKYFRIFNRWGEVVFERNNFPPNNPSYGWDGKIKGVVGPPDVFVYTAEVMCDNGTSFIYKGNVSLLK